MASKRELPILQDFGAHVSIQGGLHHAFERATELGARSIQIFCKNQRQWKGRPLGDYEVGRFRKAQRESKVGDAIAHATYLVNLASDDAEIFEKSVACLGFELQSAHSLGLRGLVVHPGSSERGVEHGVSRIAEGIEQIDDNPDYSGSMLLLEVTAGQGHAIGWQLEHLERLLRVVRPYTAERLGICLDTCHLHAAGYDVSTAAGWKQLLDEIDGRMGLERLQAVHVNDSKGARGSRVDRHANLGEGTIGLEGFRAMVAEERLLGIPKVLETPEKDGGHRRDLDTLERLAREVWG